MSLQAIALRFYLRYWFKRRLKPNAPVSVLRATVNGLVRWSPKLPPGVTVMPTNTGGVPAEWVAAPGADARWAILYFHGGGYASGSPASVRERGEVPPQAIREPPIVLFVEMTVIDLQAHGYPFRRDGWRAPASAGLLGCVHGTSKPRVRFIRTAHAT